MACSVSSSFDVTMTLEYCSGSAGVWTIREESSVSLLSSISLLSTSAFTSKSIDGTYMPSVKAATVATNNFLTHSFTHLFSSFHTFTENVYYHHLSTLSDKIHY